MKRFTLLFLAAFLIFTVSCASANGTEEKFDVDFSDFEGQVDLHGYNFQFRFYTLYSRGEDSLFGYKESSNFYDAALKRVRDVENSLNCKISLTNHSTADLESNFAAVIMSGIYFRDAVMTDSWNLRPLIEGELFEPLSEVADILDYTKSEKWGSWKNIEQCVWNGELYGVTPVLWPEVAMTTGYAFAFNEKYAGLLGQPDPREYVETNVWTREKLGEMMRTYTTDDLGYPLKGGMAYDGHFYDAALRANNVQVYKYVNGTYVSGYHTPEGQEVFEWADNFMHNEYADCMIPCNSIQDDERQQRFINGECAMLFSSGSNIYGATSAIAYEVEDYCVLPMPNGPERAKVTSEYSTFMENVKNTLLFPRNGNIEYSAYIADALFEPLEGFSKEELDDYYLRFVYHDERDYALMQQLYKNNRCSFISDGVRGNVVEKLYVNHAGTVTSVLEATEEMQNTIVREKLIPTASSLEAIFGVEALMN